jgi:hypothetical protein
MLTAHPKCTEQVQPPAFGQGHYYLRKVGSLNERNCISSLTTSRGGNSSRRCCVSRELTVSRLKICRSIFRIDQKLGAPCFHGQSSNTYIDCVFAHIYQFCPSIGWVFQSVSQSNERDNNINIIPVPKALAGERRVFVTPWVHESLK